MGMYTKASFIIPIKKDTPKNIKDICYNLFEGDSELDGFDLPKHQFFETKRFWAFAGCNSFYFTGTSNSAVKYSDSYCGGCEDMVLHIDCDLKNYDDEIELFLDWIKDYMETPTAGFIGYSLYEEDEKPTLYYLRNGKIVNE